ncbi:carbohydrate ABC transporter permease [Paenibacillus harenae]|uniref:Multiple sugar transport system permease protein n=1 Tax=Paenibacillus harenae TaxID=306543 RepID=A0ABT9U7C9_PAEHA|nr:carbohydrate ABC transporter permease [Paenibacillus harenae]MDQ0114129.1 multiple sugar transport system permease protein [Paenibacillus harenae]
MMNYRVRGQLVNLFFLSLLAFFFIFPIYWILRSSLLDFGEIMDYPPILFPEAFRWENYEEVLNRVDFLLYIGNTFIIIVPVLIGVGLTSSLAAFGFARIEFPLKNMWFSLVIMTILLPSIVTLVPTYIGWAKLGLTDTFLPLILPAFFGGGAFNIFLLRQFLLTIPRDLDESAVMDGAGFFTIYSRIILPLIRPALVAVLLFTFVGVWNDFLNQLVYLNDQDMYTVALGLSTLRSSLTSPMHLIMAGTMIMVIPATIIFLFGQRYFTEGIATTGIKG